MRALLLSLGLLAAACAAEPAPSTAGGRLPAPLRSLLLNEGHPTALPVAFDHGRHAGGESSCASCHHELAARPAAVPSACSSCHIPFYLAPEVDESLPHRHETPPDL